MSKLIDNNRITFSEFNIGDKVELTDNSSKGNITKFGIIKKFGYNTTDEIIIGVELIESYSSITKDNELFWVHPYNTITSLKKI